jgi:hypothetical protein
MLLRSRESKHWTHARTCWRGGELTRQAARARRRTGCSIPPRRTHGGGRTCRHRCCWARIPFGAVAGACCHIQACHAAELACPTHPIRTWQSRHDIKMHTFSPACSVAGHVDQPEKHSCAGQEGPRQQTTCRAVDAHTGASQTVPARRTHVDSSVRCCRCRGACIPRHTVTTACRHRQALGAAELARRTVCAAAGDRRRRIPTDGTQCA